MNEKMTPKPVIGIEAVMLAQLVIDEFNRLDLSKVELRENDKPLPITPAILDRWRFLGLSNSSFVELEFWNTRCDT